MSDQSNLDSENSNHVAVETMENAQSLAPMQKRKRRTASNQNNQKKSTRRIKRKGASKCMRSGPVTNNAFLNFLRQYRKIHCCDCTAKEAVRKGAEAWKQMSPDCKLKYIQAAKRKSRKICKGNS